MTGRREAVRTARRRVAGSAATWVQTVKLFVRLCPGRTAASIAVAVLLALVPALQVTLVAAAVQAVTDAARTATPRDFLDDVAFLGGGLALLALSSHVLNSVDQYLQTVLAADLDTKVAGMVMAKASRMELEQYEDPETYDVLQRASRDGANRVVQLLSGSLDIMRDLLTLFSMGAVLLTWNWVIALVITLSPLPAIVANLYYARKQYDLEFGRSADRRRVTYLQYLTTTDHPFKEVRLFGLAPHLLSRHAGLVERFFREDRSLARRSMLIAGLLGLVSVGLSSAAVLIALITALGSAAVGQLAGTIQAIGVVQGAATGALMGIVRMYQSQLFVGNLFQLFDLPEREIRGGNVPFPSRLSVGIEFRDVTFSYPGTGRDVLKGVSFVLPADTCTALVGVNGSGKTTIVKLLNRLYEPDSGQILVDGIGIESYDLTSLRSHMSVLFQDFIRYEMTVRENVGFGDVARLDDDDRVLDAVSRGGAGPVVESLDTALDTMLGRHFLDGHQLSIGQWQKIALARAMMRDAAVLVLDEPTASIDAKAEAEIFERLTTMARGATTLLIAHRFATVRMADRIIVIEAGRIVEQGSHSDLMTSDTEYRSMFLTQARGYRD